MDWHPWILLLHVVGAFIFILGHGVSVVVAFRIRSERDPARIGALLDLSRYSLIPAWIGLLTVVISGVIATFAENLWGKGWVWATIGILVAVLAYMSLRAVRFFDDVRHMLGMKGYYDKKDAPIPDPGTPEELDALLQSRRPVEIAAVGGGALVIIIWLMIVQPF